MIYLTLLAKPEETLIDHTENSLKVFKSIKDAYPLVPEICNVPDFWEHLFYATFLHDFGKGATGFQNIFLNKEKWNYRHEMLSAGFISSLNYENNTTLNAIGLTIITHHKDITQLRERYQTYPSPVGKERYEKKLKELEPNFEELISYYEFIPEFSRKYLGNELNNYTAPHSINELTDVYRSTVIDYYNKWDEDEKTKLHGSYGIFLKGFINACDHLASGSRYEILKGIRDMRTIYNFDLRYTQQRAFDTVGNAFLTAPTGSGKTEAALFWSDRNQNPNKSRRVFYLLPYTASINAMYDRLKKDFGYMFSWDDKNKSNLLKSLEGEFNLKELTAATVTESIDKKFKTVTNGSESITLYYYELNKKVIAKSDQLEKHYDAVIENNTLKIYNPNKAELVGVMHSKATYFLYKVFSEDDDYAIAKKKARDISELTKKIYRPYKIMTPFQMLKAFFGMRWFELQTAEMTNGLFILDEIHAYDAHNTALLLEMLKVLQTDYVADIFIMSATFPSFIKEIFKDNLNLKTEISFPKDEIKKFTRHRVKIIDGSLTDNLDKIKEDIRNKKKVLVVCNTVSIAQTVFKELEQLTKKSALIHGRFMLRDREKIEKKLKNLNLLVGTQAIEVSLNIDYDVLYTEPAPIDALIQRFGRVNRKGWEKKRISPVYVFSKGSEKDKYIYNEEIIQKTLDKIASIELLEEDVIQEVVDAIYGNGYTGKDKEEFETVQKQFRPFYNKIVPFIHDKRNEEDFYALYQSYEVVPLQYKLEYLDEIEKGHYLEAMSYHTSISVGQYKKLEKESKIEIDKNTYFVNVPYEKKLGLILDEHIVDYKSNIA